ncbi:hypothetical protein DPMN_104621 [Dreissena polymorpha]|uniref:Uncharacterized protein n=1 Tax=Dreissena polymorpha TaxID=45954 RepID=A0A9D4HAT4_DREPO|nr:hypothetical protein DPMN_104621 [Dreissena polymorpha]
MVVPIPQRSKKNDHGDRSQTGQVVDKKVHQFPYLTQTIQVPLSLNLTVGLRDVDTSSGHRMHDTCLWIFVSAKNGSYLLHREQDQRIRLDHDNSTRWPK